MVTEKKIDDELKKLVLAYITYLGRSAYELDLSETYYALIELNEARTKAGLRPAKVDFKQLKTENQKIVDEYKKLLKEKYGSYVVVRNEASGTETLEFESWLLALKTSEKLKLRNMLDQAKRENWLDDKLQSGYDDLLKFNTDVRVSAAAYVETRTVQHQIKMSTWKAGGLLKVQRIAAGAHPCKICQDLDQQVFDIDECPPLSHIKCRCIYVPYFGDSFEDITDEIGIEEAV
ncbi:MAG: hypothetical protein WCS17_04965 [Prevotella sp.]